MANNQDNVDITVNYKGGSSFVKFPPKFSNDGQNIFVCSNNSILQYNTTTGILIHEYKASDRIIGFDVYSDEVNHYLAACIQNGKYTIWKLITHFQVSTDQLPHHNIKSFYVQVTQNEHVNIVYAYFDNHMHFALWDQKPQKSNKKTVNCKVYNFSIKSKKFSLNCDNPNYFTVISKRDIYFVKTNSLKSIKKCSISEDKTFTCVASHPSEEIVLAGDSIGRVIVWQNLFSENPVQTSFHWHTLPVQTVAFSHSGSHFYSGGNECVVVKWLFENPNDRKFVPHLPAEINHITVANNNLYVAISTKDNGIRILDNTLNQISLIQHLVIGDHFKCGIVHDMRSRSLIMNGNQGQIQFYSPYDMSLLYNVDIVGQNKITNERETQMINTEVTKVAISKSGVWFATVEERKDNEYNNEIRLKFWKFDEIKQQFQLNTSVEYPHEIAINSMLFQPQYKDDYLICVTVGNDKKFKIWQITEVEGVSGTQMSWRCSGAGFYRQLSCYALSFSVDGSLFATSFEDIVTVWTPDSCVLKCSLSHSLHKNKIEYIHFGTENQCHLLVAASYNQLSVWNILTLSMEWTVPLFVSFLIADPLSTHMAVITQERKVYVFCPSSHEPLYTNDDLLKSFTSIKACNFVPSKNSNDVRLNWYERTQLYFITSDNELYCLSGIEETGLNNMEYGLVTKSVYEKINPELKYNAKQSVDTKIHSYKKDVNEKSLQTYLESPLHTLVPIRFSCHSLLKSLVMQDED